MLTQELLKQHLSYNHLTGIFNWRIPPMTRYYNSIVGYLDKDGYRIIGLFKKRYKAHRLAFLYMTGVFLRIKLTIVMGKRTTIFGQI